MTIPLKPTLNLLGKRFGEKFDEIPMILSGDFNFAEDKYLPLITFMKYTLGLTMYNDRKLNITKYKTNDAVLIRYLDKIQSKHFCLIFQLA